jgi:hypothetical protein
MRTRIGYGTKIARGAALLWWFAIFIAIFFASNLVASAQSLPSDLAMGPRPSSPSRPHHKFKGPSLPALLTPLKPQPLEAPYHPFTPRDSLRWFSTTTLDPANLVGGIFDSAFGTSVNRPKEYGPHWGGFANRYGMGMTRSVASNAFTASSAHFLREDPRYFRVPDRPFKARVGNVVKLAFTARGGNGSFGPAYARYIAFFGDNFLSNSWRVHSEANSHDALLRASEGFGGLLAGNAFEEFWPDVKKRVFHKYR